MIMGDVITSSRIDAARQKAIDTAQQIEAECREVLVGSFRGHAIPRADSLQASDSIRAALAAPWSDRRRNPNAWSIEQLARALVRDSHRLREAGWREDAGETRVTATMLKQVIARAIPTLYVPNFTRATFPVRTDVRPSARTYAHYRLIDHGDFALHTPGSTDVPEVTISAEEDERRLSAYAAAFGWDMDELEEAVMAGVPLQTEKLSVLNRAAERRFELVGLLGEPAAGTVGMYNDPNVPVIGALTGTWSGATMAQILEDLRNFIFTIMSNSEDNYEPNRVVIPSELWQYLGERNTSTDRTVRELLQEEFPGLTLVRGSSRTNTLDAAGTGPRIMGFNRNTELLALVVARALQLEAPERRGFAYRVQGRMKLGGASIHHPLTAGYMDGC